MAGLGDFNVGSCFHLEEVYVFYMCDQPLVAWTQPATMRSEKHSLCAFLGDSIFLQWLFMGSNFNIDGSQAVCQADL